MKLDYSLDKYTELCNSIQSSEYKAVTVKDYILSNRQGKYIILRHDVDSEPEYFLRVAKLEHELGLKSTYYFRTIDEIFTPEIIEKVAAYGHEIGFHYEVLNLSLGNTEKALELFADSLKKLRKITDIKTIAQHGSPLVGFYEPTIIGSLKLLKRILKGEKIFSKWRSIDLWNKYNYKDWGIIAEAYIDIDYQKVLYLSDTGRSWDNSKNKAKDYPPQKNFIKYNIKSTNDLISIINAKKFDQICLLTHVNQWKSNYFDWYKYAMLTNLRNIAKRSIMLKWKRKSK